MSQKDFFRQLRDELHGHPYRDRFLEELENHTEDLIEDKKSKDSNLKLMNQTFGTPKNIKKDFLYIMHPYLKLWSITLYGFSIWALWFIWSLTFNGLLAPWDGTAIEQRPAIGTWERTVNDFFEKGIGTTTLVYTFLAISLLILFLKLRKQKGHSIYRIIDYMGTLNFLYIGLFFAIFILWAFIGLKDFTIDFNFIALSIHVPGILTLFYAQIKGVGLHSKIVMTP